MRVATNAPAIVEIPWDSSSHDLGGISEEIARDNYATNPDFNNPLNGLHTNWNTNTFSIDTVLTLPEDQEHRWRRLHRERGFLPPVRITRCFRWNLDEGRKWASVADADR